MSLQWMVEEVIDAEHVEYTLYDDRADAEYHHLTASAAGRGGRILTVIASGKPRRV